MQEIIDSNVYTYIKCASDKIALNISAQAQFFSLYILELFAMLKL